MKCTKCGNEFEGNFCSKCGEKVTDKKYEDVYPNESEKIKQSTLGIVAMILSFTGCFAIIGLILAIIDLAKKDDTKKHTCSVIAIVVCTIILIIGIVNMDSSPKSNTETNKTITSTDAKIEETEAKETEEEITYTAYAVSDMMNDLSSNALNAKNTYDDQYVEITGRLGVIDASGKYISIYSSDDPYDFTGVQCNIQNDDQKTQVAEMSVDDTVTLKGKITNVGEIMGYTLDIDEIE